MTRVEAQETSKSKSNKIATITLDDDSDTDSPTAPTPTTTLAPLFHLKKRKRTLSQTDLNAPPPLQHSQQSLASDPPTKVIRPSLPSMISATSLRPLHHFTWHPVPATPSLLHGTYSPPSLPLLPSAKVAAFDLDGTLISTRSGGSFARNKDDWKVWSDGVVPKLKELHGEGYTILLLTNQNYKGARLDWFKQKLPNIAETFGVPFRVLAATEKDRYRKPEGGMWKRFCEEWNGGVEVDLKLSFYVGDAAGRPSIPGRRRQDHSNSDLKMAQCVNLPFHTPEDFFV